MGSRLFIYYNERKIEGTIEEDADAQLHDCIDTLKIYGVCPESDWPYDVTKFAQTPPLTCYSDALKHHVINAYNINNDINSMKNCLASGYPFVVGISIYESFETQEVAKTGIVPMPIQKEECLGGHTVLVCGYDDATHHWILRNSWGTEWGDNGYFYLPYVYLLDSSLCSDLWYISRVEVENKPVTAAPINKLESIINRLRSSLPLIN
jgi:C1A family cysteine protease